MILPKIVSPLSKLEEIEPLIEAGAEEFFCGLLTGEWTDTVSPRLGVSRRSGAVSHFTSYDELTQAVRTAHKKNREISLALNEAYIKQQYPLITEYARKAAEAGIDAIIVSDPGFLVTLKRLKLKTKLYISSLGTVFNNSTMDFYAGLGASRIILPLELDFGAIEELSSGRPRNIELEVFIINSKCKNIDGLCRFAHRSNLGQEKKIRACSLIYKVEPVKSVSRLLAKEIEPISNKRFIVDKCGACKIQDIARMGIDFLKISGREFPSERKIRETRFIRKAVDLCGADRNGNDLEKGIKKLYRQHLGRYCDTGYCYWPEESS